MTKVAQLTHDRQTGQYKAIYDGIILARSTDVNYVIQAVENGSSTKARQLGITQIMRMDEVDVGVTSDTEVATGITNVYFPINERFEFLKTLTNMVVYDRAPSLIVTGPGGYGKTYTVTECIEAAGLSFTTDFLDKVQDPDVVDDDDEDGDEEKQNPADVHIVKGFSTAKGLYRTLYENNGKLIVFDDCDSILRNSDAVNILKGALDSYSARWISWNAEPRPGESNPLPRKFEFTGRIIFISNKGQHEMDGAIKSRSLRVDLSMTNPEKIERMRTIAEGGKFMSETPRETIFRAIEFLDECKNQTTELSMRTLISVTKIILDAETTDKPYDWKRLALYNVTAGS